MNRSELVVGRIYVVAGRGEMMLTELSPIPEDSLRAFQAYGGNTLGYGGTVKFAAHGGGSCWAAPEDVAREATQEDLKRRDAQARSRGVACDDPECWCRKACHRLQFEDPVEQARR